MESLIIGSFPIPLSSRSFPVAAELSSLTTADLYNAKHLIVLCADDAGVFSTSLSGEYILAFGLDNIYCLLLEEEFLMACSVLKDYEYASYNPVTRSVKDLCVYISVLQVMVAE
ncbi:hypothetical protein F0562_025147 [Nyssa sinensis]|uniref:Uncharacterized protein n=1 Tax=Nyssa sinensis TaxID=561372 RepID=A0A5J5BF17_9ASTE|nr:hypothetical protein F0562_025147 [Nyssa sinensis]